MQVIKDILGDLKHIGILGYGMEGRSTHKIITATYPEANIYVMDQSAGVKVETTEHTHVFAGAEYKTGLEKCEVVFRSPGVRLTDADYNGIVTSQAELFTQIKRKQIIGITGTKGKSTTTSLIHHLLSHKYKVALVGNIGVPALDCLEEDYDYYVFEYSCHQLSDMTTSPAYAVLLNLFPEHLDYYPTEESYYASKKNIYKYQDQNEHYYSILSLAEHGKAISLDQQIKVGEHSVLANNDNLTIDEMSIHYCNTLKGVHNKLNQLFAVTISIELGLSITDIAYGLSTFLGLSHRLETVYEANGLRYVNDSISTIPQSTIAAINSYDDVSMVLVGGFDRGIDYLPLTEYLSKRTDFEVVLFSQVGKKLAGMMSSGHEVRTTFDEAVKYCLEKAQKGTVIMSPGASSYDEFKSFVHRGNRYKELINKYFNK